MTLRTHLGRAVPLLALPLAYAAAQWVGRARREAPPLFVAHRGGAATAPENTLAAFTAAAAAGVLAWELDVQRSRDGELVVFHDDVLDRTTNGHGAPGAYSYIELAGLDAGGWFGPSWRGERIPRLRDVIALAQDVGSQLLIELKSPARYPGIEQQVVELLAHTGFGPHAFILSFDPTALARVHALDPALRLDLNYVGHLVTPPTQPGLQAIGPEWRGILLNPAAVRVAHGRGQQVFAWTANSARAVRALAALGVDGVISDRLDLRGAVADGP